MNRSLVLKLAAWAARVFPEGIKRLIYRSPALSHRMRQMLNQAAPHGLTEVVIAAGGLQGARLLLDMQSEKDYWLGTYEPDLQTALRHFAASGMIVYDVGANIGYISLLCARLVGPDGRIFSFEALPANLGRLKKNIELNGFAPCITVVPSAVVDGDREVSFLVGPSSGMGKVQGSAGREEPRSGDVIQVQGISVDSFVYKQRNPEPQIIKLDIEGGEVLAIPGMRRVLHEARPVLLMELHGPASLQAAWEILQQENYRISRMKSPYSPIVSMDSLDWKSYLVAVPERHSVSSRGLSSSPEAHSEVERLSHGS